jgi:hypothetical protein
MKKQYLVTGFFISLLLLSSCVSKKKYVQLQKKNESSVKGYEENLGKSRARIDSLQLVIAQKDTIIDSLSLRLAEYMKKDKTRSGNNGSGGTFSGPKKSSSLSKEQELDKKSLFIYNFTKFIEWPLEYNGTEFVIAVNGSDAVIKQMQGFLADKKTFGKKIIVKKYVKGARYNIVYITSAKSSSLYTVKNDVKHNKTVVITDDELNGQGSHISFIVDDDKVRYTVNKLAIEKLGLKVGQELMRYSG